MRKNIWRGCLALAAAAVLGACGGVQEAEMTEPSSSLQETGEVSQSALVGTQLGMVTGGIYDYGAQPLSTHDNQVMCELGNLGAKWIRIEADWTNPDGSRTSASTYQSIVQRARSRGLKVVVLVPARYCGADNQPSQIDPFISNYVNRLSYLANNVFVGPAQADAYEIGNELNIEESGCGDGVRRFRVGPNAFAWLLRRVWEWKNNNGRPEAIISGGLLNTYTTEGFWPAFFNSGAFLNYKGSRPFNYFGIHPYNPWHIDQNCVNGGGTTCFAAWKSNVTSGLQTVASQVNSATGTTGTQLFATEFGWQLPTGTTCATAANCVVNTTQQAAGMQAAGEAMVASGVTPFGLWYDYRDDNAQRFGVRGLWNGSSYPAKSATWSKFYSLAGGTGSTDPQACWGATSGTYYKLIFENGDARRTTSTGDWSYGHAKAECASGEQMTGLSMHPSTKRTHAALCRRDNGDNWRYPHNGCYTRVMRNGENRGVTWTGDWDYGYWKTECGANEFVAGISKNLGDHQVEAVLCCPGSVNHNSCSAKVLGSAGAQETSETGDWDWGYWKAECGVGRYVAGVSREVSPGNPHAILCCSP